MSVLRLVADTGFTRSCAINLPNGTDAVRPIHLRSSCGGKLRYLRKEP